MPGDPLFLVTMHVTAAALLRLLKPNLATAVLLAVVLIASTGVLGAKYGEEVLLTVYRGRDAALTLAGREPGWPPEKYRSYPDLQLVDAAGASHRLAELSGKVVLVELVGMSCRASVAFSGGKRCMPFRGVAPQSNLDRIATYAREFGRVDLHDPRLVHVQLVLFNQQMQAPSPQELAAWVRHFGERPAEGPLVLAGTVELATSANRRLVPGFQLIDKRFLLRFDSTGQPAEDDLYCELLPAIGRLLDE